MIELLVAYLLYEGGAGSEWWTLFAILFAFKIWGLWRALIREKEENFVIHKIINEAKKHDNIH